jgi:hypothetical protein
MKRNRSLYYKVTTPKTTTTCIVKLANFYLVYLMARIMSDIAVKNNGVLVVKKLTLAVAVQYRAQMFINKLWWKIK